MRSARSGSFREISRRIFIGRMAWGPKIKMGSGAVEDSNICLGALWCCLRRVLVGHLPANGSPRLPTQVVLFIIASRKSNNTILLICRIPAAASCKRI